MPLYSFGLLLSLAISAPVWGWRMLRQGRYRQGLGQRLGAVPQRLREYVRTGDVIWVHAVSVGEAVAATRLIGLLEAALPTYRIVLSTTTPTGQTVARERFGADRAFFFPLDFAFAVRAYLRVLRPRMVVLMESELWPRMLVECDRAGVPVAVVNARVSDRSLPRYLALRAMWRPLLAKVTSLLAQSEEDARRWERIGAGAGRVRSIGNLKYDARVAAETPLTTAVRKHLPASAAVLVLGSTHEGEEAILLQCWRALPERDAVMVLAPRHPERASAVAGLVTSHDLCPVRLSEWRLATRTLTTNDVLLVDTVGELAGLYSLASVAFVGGSLVPEGGHNPLEPAQFGVPILMGPHYQNFREIVDGMRAHQAIRIVNEANLCATVALLLSVDEAATERNRQMGAHAKRFFGQQAGATERAVNALLQLLPTERQR